MGKNWIKKIRTIAATLTWSLFLAAVGVGAGAFNREKRQIIQVIQIEKPKVALTFDDGPNKKYTPALLNELGKRGIHASFFLMGKTSREMKSWCNRCKRKDICWETILIIM